MSSLESHTMVPTLTMLGRVREWIRLLSMAEAAVTRLIIAPRSAQRVVGGLIRDVSWPGATISMPRGLMSNGAACWNRRARGLVGGYCAASVHGRADLHADPPDQPH